jgi:crotonobetainyl-CoA:carnitine CoA-transferase CaiB-like acyl-CoA transferase
MLLADLGAEVIRVESLQHFPPSTRGRMPRPAREAALQLGYIGRSYVDLDPGERPWDRHAMFNCHARNKLSMTLDVVRAEGRRVFEDLLRLSDVVIENNSAATRRALGLDYAALVRARPDLVFVSMPSFGEDGPYAEYRGYGANTEALAGLTWLRGYPDLDPSTTANSYHMDAASGAAAAFATIAALHHRNRAGRGQFIDFAQAENLIPQIGEALMDLAMNDRDRTTLGNRDPSRAPHGVYPCRPGAEPEDPDRWLAIAVETDAQFRALCAAMARPELARNRRFATAVARWRNQDALDAEIASWTCDQDVTALFRRLQDAGVPAGPVLSDRAAHDDPALAARGFFHTVTHPHAGTHPYPGFPYRFTEIPLAFRRPPCSLGEHNAYVYRDLLGYPEAEIARLTAEGHIGDAYLGG